MKKKKNEPKDYISHAIEVQKKKLSYIKLMTELLFFISRVATTELRQEMGMYGENQQEFSRCMNSLQNILSAGENSVHRKISAFVDIDPKVNEMLRRETLKWFEKEDHAIMSSYLDMSSYYDEEEKTFRKQVLDALKKDFR
jgi:proline dehydrogenase